MLYIGIDPGEAWCGFAALDVSPSGVRTEARTYAVKAHGGYLGMTRDILDLLPHARPTQIVVEDFRIRRSGHQHFNAGHTLRFLGALEYGISEITAFSFFLIPPNDRGKQETRELYGRIFPAYHRQWPRPKHTAWGHCLSAWRVLGHHLFQHDRDVLLELHGHQKSHRCSQWLPALVRAPKNEHIAPAAWWVKHR
jgi:hypothetical protein